MDSAEAVKDLFRKWDKDENGYISKEELASALGSLGLDSRQVGALFQAADVSNDEGLDYSEFISWVLDSTETLPDRMVHKRPDKSPRTWLRSTANPSKTFCIPGCSVPNGAIVEVYPKRVLNGMVRVTVEEDGKEGWLKRTYLQPLDEDRYEKLYEKMVNRGCYELRSCADPDFAGIYCIPGQTVQDGEIVDVLPPRRLVHCEGHDMVQVLLQNGTKGWLERTQLEAVEELPAKMVHQRTDSIPCTSLRSCADPSRTYCIQGQTVQNGEIVDVLPPRITGNGMVQVSLQNGNKGWLRLDYLEAVEELPAKMVHQRNDSIPCTSLRSCADPSRRYCIRGQTVQNGETVDVLPPRLAVNGMVQVLLQNGNKGWLRLDYLEAVEELPAKMVHQRTDSIPCTSLRSCADPSRTYCIRGQTVQNGETVDVLPPRLAVNGMVQVRLQNENTGWLRLDYLRGRSVARGSAAKIEQDASIIAYKGCPHDGIGFSLAPAEFNDLLKMWAELKNARETQVEEADADVTNDPDMSDEEFESYTVTDISQYSIEKVLACIQKYQDGKPLDGLEDGGWEGAYDGEWYLGGEEKVTHMLEEIKKVVRTADGDATGFHVEDFDCDPWGNRINITDAFLFAGHLLLIEFGVYDNR